MSDPFNEEQWEAYQPQSFDALPTTTEFSGETILHEAYRLVYGARNHSYGHPSEDYRRTGVMWGALLHRWISTTDFNSGPVPVPPELCVLMMVAVKLSRQCHESKRDNLVDGAGYLACAERILENK